jgi:hypothetical protein
MKLRQQKYHYREPRYIREVEKLNEHLGSRLTNVCREQAAFAVSNAKYELLKAQVYVAEMEISYEFTNRIHSMLERGANADEALSVYGDFEAFQTEYLSTTGKYRWSKEVCTEIAHDNYWWRRDE